MVYICINCSEFEIHTIGPDIIQDLAAGTNISLLGKTLNKRVQFLSLASVINALCKDIITHAMQVIHMQLAQLHLQDHSQMHSLE